MQAELEQLVRDPFAHAEPGARRVDADRRPPQHEAFADGHHRADGQHVHDAGRHVANRPASTPQVSSAHQTRPRWARSSRSRRAPAPTTPSAAAAGGADASRRAAAGAPSMTSTVGASASTGLGGEPGPARSRRHGLALSEHGLLAEPGVRADRRAGLEHGVRADERVRRRP